jgi:hypothetical protein
MLQPSADSLESELIVSEQSRLSCALVGAAANVTIGQELAEGVSGWREPRF